MDSEQHKLIEEYKKLLAKWNDLSAAYDRGYDVSNEFFKVGEELDALKCKIVVDDPIYFRETIQGRVMTKNERIVMLKRAIEEKKGELEKLKDNEEDAKAQLYDNELFKVKSLLKKYKEEFKKLNT